MLRRYAGLVGQAGKQTFCLWTQCAHGCTCCGIGVILILLMHNLFNSLLGNSAMLKA